MLSRAVSLASVPVRSGARFAAAAGAVAFGADKDDAYAKATQTSVEVLTAALSKARGPALKFGQVLALFSQSLPPEQAAMLASLGSLYENATPRPWSAVAEQVSAVLPDGVAVEPVAVAAASLGQVHRGVWMDGTPVAVKVLYPDAHRIVRADLLQLRTFVPLIHRLMPTLDVKALLDEHADRLWEELDYTREGRWQSQFAAAWQQAHPGVVTVPRVLHASEGVLVTEWLDGVPFADLAAAPAADRDRAGRALARFTLWSPGLVGAVHADPHPGNYRLLADGTLGVLDFGSVGSQVGSFTRLFVETFVLADAGDLVALHALWVRTGMMSPTTTTEDLVRILALDLRPYQQPEFTFTRGWLTDRADGWTDPGAALSDVSKLSMPPQILLEHRAVGGMLALLASIEATVDFRTVIDGAGRPAAGRSRLAHGHEAAHPDRDRVDAAS